VSDELMSNKLISIEMMIDKLGRKQVGGREPPFIEKCEGRQERVS
jgi:hypothetical protein